jgi:signal peptide peptidase SppA
MELLDFSKGQVWGIIPEHFETLARKFFELDLKVEQKDFEAYLKSGRGGEEKPYRITDGGSAIIPISGPLTKKMSFFSFLFGGTTYGMIANMFKMAIEDEDVNSIILDIDSPGGVVSGTESVGDLIFNSRGIKPVVGFANGMMASAAYWIGSAAEYVIAEKTAQVGSIGVLMVHRDYSKMDAKEGIETTYITAGKYKALGNPDEPLSKFAKEYFQEEVDYIYSIFVDTVARNREVGSDKVLTDMADGRIFTGQKAEDAGLVDNIGDFDSAVQMAESMITESQSKTIRSFIMKNEQKIETVDQLTMAFPDLVNQIQDDAVKAATGQIKSDAIKAEQDRILELVGIQFDDDQAQSLKKVIESGVTVEQFEAVKKASNEPKAVDEEDEELKKKLLEGLESSGAGDPGAGDAGSGSKDYMTLVDEYMTAHNCPRLKAMQEVNRAHPKAREDYISKNNPQMANAG